MTSGVFDNLPLSYPDSDYLPLNPQKDRAMTDAPEKIWVDYSPHTEGWGDVSVAEEHGYTEYLRKDKHLAYLADYRAAYEGSCEQIDGYKAKIETLQAEVARLRGERAMLHFTLAAVKAHMEETN